MQVLAIVRPALCLMTALSIFLNHHRCMASLIEEFVTSPKDLVSEHLYLEKTSLHLKHYFAILKHLR